MAISIPNTFTPSTNISSSQVNSNFSALSAGALDKTGDTLTGTLVTLTLKPTADNTSDLGDSTHAYRNFYSKGTVQLGGVTYTFPAADGSSGLVLKTNGSATLSWGVPQGVRVNGTTSSTTPTPNADTTDLYSLTAQAAGATFGAPTGTPVNGQRLIVRIKDNGTARALAWNASYVAGGVALPTTTVISKILTIGFIYNTDNALNKWQCVAVAQEA